MTPEIITRDAQLTELECWYEDAVIGPQNVANLIATVRAAWAELAALKAERDGFSEWLDKATAHLRIIADSAESNSNGLKSSKPTDASQTEGDK